MIQKKKKKKRKKIYFKVIFFNINKIFTYFKL